MSRPKQNRKVCAPPKMSGYKPFGIPRTELDSVTLHIDEYEAIRLLDYEGLMQEEAAVLMEVSRPTLTRIYNQARRTVAQAFVEGKMILIEGGNVSFDEEWFRCRRCHKLVGGRKQHRHCKDGAPPHKDDLIPIGRSKFP